SIRSSASRTDPILPPTSNCASAAADLSQPRRHQGTLSLATWAANIDPEVLAHVGPCRSGGSAWSIAVQFDSEQPNNPDPLRRITWPIARANGLHFTVNAARSSTLRGQDASLASWVRIITRSP